MEVAGAFPSRRHFCERPLRVNPGKTQIEKKCSAVPQLGDIHAHERKLGVVP
jgi:hypothetical protein